MLVRRILICGSSVQVDRDWARAEAFIDSWDTSLEKGPKDGSTVPIYRACKIEGERQAWKWVEKNQPQFELNSVLPWLTVSISQRRNLLTFNNWNDF
jgi:hypothetical protein